MKPRHHKHSLGKEDFYHVLRVHPVTSTYIVRGTTPNNYKSLNVIVLGIACQLIRTKVIYKSSSSSLLKWVQSLMDDNYISDSLKQKLK